MNIIKKFFKILIIILIIILSIFILYSMFFDFLGCYLIFNNDHTLDELLEKYDFDSKNVRVIFLDTDFKDNNNIITIDKNLSINNINIKTNNKLVEYIKMNGIDIYNTVIIVSYFYIIIVAIIIFLKKVSENIDKFSKFQEKDN